MDAMEGMAKAMKAMTQRVKDNRDADAVRADARSIHDLAAKIAPLFPPGSNQHPSEAKAAIWQNWSDFEAKAQPLGLDSAKLAGAPGSEARSLGTQLRAVSQACSACHEAYRAKVMKHSM